MTIYHQDLAAGRWFSLSLANQLGNVGSEYFGILARSERDKAAHAVVVK